jgi:hypothetical protein
MDGVAIYAARNRCKVRRTVWVFDAAWNLAKTTAKEKWGQENASLYISTALCNQLARDGHNIRSMFKNMNLKSNTCTGVGASLM